MILIDNFNHLVATESEAELHAFASKIGLKRVWFQKREKHPHYDITSERMRWRAMSEGAKLVPMQMLVQKAWWKRK